MATLPSPRGAKNRPRLEIIPFIDIMFFLLATFMMVSLSMVQNQGVNVRLPVAATGKSQDRPEDSVKITITEVGDYFYNKEPATAEQVNARLKSLKATQPDPKVFINSDGRADFERVVAVLDGARKLGITKIAIETTSKRE